jgi:hypothetical protein
MLGGKIKHDGIGGPADTHDAVDALGEAKERGLIRR